MYNLIFYFSAGGGGGGRPSNPLEIDIDFSGTGPRKPTPTGGGTGNIGTGKIKEGKGGGVGEKWFVYCCENEITITQNQNLECDLLTEPFDNEEEAMDWANKNFPSGKC